MMNKIVGMLLLVTCITSCASNQGIHTGESDQRNISRNTITREEIKKSSATNGYEIVQSLRPDWLYTIDHEWQDVEAENLAYCFAYKKDRVRCLILQDKRKVGEDEKMLQSIPARTIASIQFSKRDGCTIRIRTCQGDTP